MSWRIHHKTSYVITKAETAGILIKVCFWLINHWLDQYEILYSSAEFCFACGLYSHLGTRDELRHLFGGGAGALGKLHCVKDISREPDIQDP